MEQQKLLSWESRRNILMEIPGVVDVVHVDDSDDTVCAALKDLKPDFLAMAATGLLRIHPKLISAKR